MQNNNVLSVGDMASALGGAGLTQITTNLHVALILVGAGVALKVLVAILNKNNISIEASRLG